MNSNSKLPVDLQNKLTKSIERLEKNVRKLKSIHEQNGRVHEFSFRLAVRDSYNSLSESIALNRDLVIEQYLKQLTEAPILIGGCGRSGRLCCNRSYLPTPKFYLLIGNPIFLAGLHLMNQILLS